MTLSGSWAKISPTGDNGGRCQVGQELVKGEGEMKSIECSALREAARGLAVECREQGTVDKDNVETSPESHGPC